MPAREKTIDVTEELEEAFFEYSQSVLLHRSLPDVRDGLKPVQRRILYAMWQGGNLPTKPHKKSMSAVSDTMKLYHPHGDSAVYDAMARMAQPFTINVPVVDGHGNFGGLDHPPAAPRYTEARLAEAGVLLLEGIKDECVNFIDNFDSTAKEPEVLPAPWPSLLVNGASGIAVGWATDIPQHNITETITAVRHRLKNPNCQLKSIMNRLPAPDYPGGALLLEDESDLLSLYKTGKGHVTLRARHSVTSDGMRQVLDFTEIPYSTTPERIIAKIQSSSAKDGPLEHIIESQLDLTDRKNGLLIRVVLKKGVTASKALEALYATTPLQSTLHYTMNGLEGDRFITGTLIGLIDTYIAHRKSTIRKRTQFWLKKTDDRLSDLSVLSEAYNRLDEVINICKKSPRGQLIAKLRKALPGATARQAQMVADMPLHRLGSLALNEIRKETKKLSSDKVEYERILASDSNLTSELDRDLQRVQKHFGTYVRRTEITHSAASQSTAETKGPDMAYLLHDGRITNIWPGPNEAVAASRPNDDGMLCVLSKDGTATRISHSSLAASTEPMAMKSAEPIAIIPEGADAFLMSSTGKGKITDMSLLLRVKAYTEGKPTVCMNITEGEELLSAGEMIEGASIAAVASDGDILVMDPEDISKQQLKSTGVTIMSSRKGRTILSAGPAGTIYGAQLAKSAAFESVESSSMERASRATKGRRPKNKKWPDEIQRACVSMHNMVWKPRKKAFCIKTRVI